MFAYKKHILALTKIKRTRTFPSKGEIQVRVGQKLSAVEPIGTFINQEGFALINVRKELNLKKNKDVRQIVKHKTGDILQPDEPIAESGGLFSKTIRSPFLAEILTITSSQVLVRNLTNKEQFPAGFDAVVSEVLPDRGVILETDGVLIQGVWGNQKTQSGLLNPILKKPDHKLEISEIDVTFRGSILAAGYCDNPNVIKYANELPLKGLILSSIHPDLIPYCQAVEFPIIITEGFGPISMNRRTFQLLITNAKRDVSLNTEFDFKRGQRPEIIIPLPSEGFVPNDVTEIKAGLTVKITAGPWMGRIGKIKKIIDSPIQLQNGIKTNCAVIELDREENEKDENTQYIPLANIDVVE